MADNTPGTPGRENTPKQSGLSWSQPSNVARPGTPPSTLKFTPPKQPMPPIPAAPAAGGRRSLMLFAGGVLVGGLLAWSWFSLTPTQVTVDTEPTTGTAAEVTGSNTSGASTGAESTGGTLPGSTIGSEALVVPSPQDAGLSVMISSANVSSPTWVVVYDSKSGVRGNALGATLFFPQGAAKSVKLLRATEAGKTYLIGRHIDNNDKQFSLTNDKPVTNAAGNPVYVEFRTR